MIKKVLRPCYRYLFSGAGGRISLSLKAIVYFRDRNFTVARYIASRLQIKYGVFISPKAAFDITLQLRHPIGIIIGDGVKLGKNIIIFQNVTVGGARLGDGISGNYPEIGDNTVIFSGAAVVGAVKIGKNCVVGANSVVTRDVPDNCTAVGAPARVIKKS